MLIINNIPILVSIRDILVDVRSELLIQGINVFPSMKISHNNLITNCPFHKDSHPSFGILLKKRRRGDKIIEVGTYSCFSCKRTGSLGELISTLFGYKDGGVFGDKWLTDKYSDFELEDRSKVFVTPSRELAKIDTIQYVTEEELCKYRFYHDYMFSRGLTEDIIDKFDIGYQSDTQLAETAPCFESITFPVRDIHGNCLFVAKRAINIKLFVLPQDLDKPIYGLYELQYMFPDTTCIYVCESVFNALTLIRFGLPAVALFGTGTDSQIQQLAKSSYRAIYLCLDGDTAGKKGIKRLTKGLGCDKIVYTVETPTDGTDINNHWQDGIEWFNSLPKNIA